MAVIKITLFKKELIIKNLINEINISEKAETPSTWLIKHITHVLTWIIKAITLNYQETITIEIIEIYSRTETKEINKLEIDTISG